MLLIAIKIFMFFLNKAYVQVSTFSYCTYFIAFMFICLNRIGSLDSYVDIIVTASLHLALLCFSNNNS